MDKDGSVVLAGGTEGDFALGSKGQRDFVVVKLDAEGKELWRWQVGALETRSSLLLWLCSLRRCYSLMTLMAAYFVRAPSLSCGGHLQTAFEFGMFRAKKQVECYLCGTGRSSARNLYSKRRCRT